MSKDNFTKNWARLLVCVSGSLILPLLFLSAYLVLEGDRKTGSIWGVLVLAACMLTGLVFIGFSPIPFNAKFAFGAAYIPVYFTILLGFAFWFECVRYGHCN
jgi:hypothetical protein